MNKLFKEGMWSCTVKLLDGEELTFDTKKSVNGREILDKACDHIGVEEKDYFGLRFVNNRDKQLSWLDNIKTLGKQLGKGPYSLMFGIKFYPPSPADLQEDISRYQFVLQLRDDLLRGRMMCSVPTHALLASYVIEAEKGDYDPAAHGPKYLDNLKFMPNQPPEFLEKVKEFHKKHKGLSPADAEFQYLENARKLPLYGIELHHAYDGDQSEVVLGISSQGLHVIRHGRQINKFSWPSIHKVFFRGKRFHIKIRVVTELEYEDVTVGFRCRTRTELKRLYRSAVDHHTFFRRDAPLLVPKRVYFFKLGSRFRYSGRRTFHQTKTQEHSRPPPSFQRISSERFSIRLRNNSVLKKTTSYKLKQKQSENKKVDRDGLSEDGSPTINRAPEISSDDKEDEKPSEQYLAPAEVDIIVTPASPMPSKSDVDSVGSPSRSSESVEEREITTTVTTFVERTVVETTSTQVIQSQNATQKDSTTVQEKVEIEEV